MRAMNQSEVLCRCLNVTHHEVHQAIDVLAAQSVQDVAKLTDAGTGCMCCRRCIKDIIRQKQMQASVAEYA